MSDDNIEFVNMDTYRGSGGKFGLTFKQIILMHVNRCVMNGSVEWHGGYWEQKVSGGGGSASNVERKYIPNSRDVYCNSVRMLRAIMLCYFDDKIEQPEKEIQKDLKTLKEKYKAELEKGNKSFKSEYNEEKVELYIRLFEELVLLGKRLNFFEEEEVTDVI